MYFFAHIFSHCHKLRHKGGGYYFCRSSIKRQSTLFLRKNRVLHDRITNDTNKELIRVCSVLECSITDYVTSILDESFDQKPLNILPESSKEYVKRTSYNNGKMWIGFK